MTPSDIVQKSKKQSRLFQQQGQALVEYVLLLVVTVSLLLALVYQIFRPFQSFVKSYMGDYTACLLETGELPSLGNQDSQDKLSEEGCNSKFESATLASGRPSNYASTNVPFEKRTESDSNSAVSKSENSSGSGSSSSSASGPGGNNLLISSMKKKSGTESGGEPSGKVSEIPLAQQSKFYNRKDSYSKEFGANNGKTKYVAITGMSEEEKKKKERQENARRVIASGDGLADPSKKTPVKPPPPKPVVEAEESPMTFGNFFRFLLIAAIIIAIIVVLGSQALKIAKSQEK